MKAKNASSSWQKILIEFPMSFATFNWDTAGSLHACPLEDDLDEHDRLFRWLGSSSTNKISSGESLSIWAK